VSRAREALAAARAQAEARGARPVRPVRRLPDHGDTAGGTDGDGHVPVPGIAGRTPADAPADGAPVEGVGAWAPAGREPGQQSPARRGRRGLSTARPGFAAQRQREDPQPLSAAIGGLVEAEGWGLAAATGSVFGRWAQIVGADLAAHTTPEALTDGELTVAADSTAWATQVRLLAAQLVRRLNAELGDGTVQRVRVRGPVTNTRRPGDWRVRGSRGPRDTYG
jgi:predicted nucleic acid-binding Zn ribbon protein